MPTASEFVECGKRGLGIAAAFWAPLTLLDRVRDHLEFRMERIPAASPSVLDLRTHVFIRGECAPALLCQALRVLERIHPLLCGRAKSATATPCSRLVSTALDHGRCRIPGVTFS